MSFHGQTLQGTPLQSQRSPHRRREKMLGEEKIDREDIEILRVVDEAQDVIDGIKKLRQQIDFG